MRDSRETSVLRKDHLKLLRRRILANTSYRSRSKSTRAMLARGETGGPRSLIEKSLFIPFIPFYLFGGHRREGNFDNWRWSNKPNRNWNRSSVACIDSVTYPFPAVCPVLDCGRSNLKSWKSFVRNLGSFSLSSAIFLVSLSLSLSLFALTRHDSLARFRHECPEWTSTVNICFCINEMESGRIGELIGRNVVSVRLVQRRRNQRVQRF